jgi:hypothetical protein
MKFPMQFIDLCLGLVESLFARSSDLVDPSLAPSNIPKDGLQQAAALQAMQERVERSRPDAIPVMRQLLHHGQSKDGLVGSVHKHVNPYESEKEFSLFLQHKVNIPLPAQTELDNIELRYMLFGTEVRFNRTS